MQIEKLIHTMDGGWSMGSFPALDSDHTLVTIFGSSDRLDDPRAIREVMSAYPRAHVIGCSTAGEIFGASIRDGSLAVAGGPVDHTHQQTPRPRVGRPAP